MQTPGCIFGNMNQLFLRSVALTCTILLFYKVECNSKSKSSDSFSLRGNLINRRSTTSSKNFNTPFVFLCSIINYDYYNLTSTIWSVTLQKEHCLPLNATAGSPDSCTVHMAFCHKLGIDLPCANDSVCHSSTQGNLSVGGFSENPFNATKPPQASDGFQANFPNGGPYQTFAGGACNLATTVAFQCNHSAHWLVSSSATKAVRIAPDPKKVHFDQNNCLMTLTFDFAGACRRSSNSPKSLSAGTVLIVIFLVSSILYFVFGSMVNISRRRSGSQIVPHSKFWTMLPVYVMDGCQFFFCCGRTPVTNTYDQI
ncbi:uncharacterized protein LOC101860291 isoform X2 [Aplysia californica]|uniref:Uncharacterized protein LOC101860291 isoform X2 n=1 Tax=Aplysia californica TaxID=6500 RepID=A0ABM1VPJ7_APLCA|nr:uncharacterized protein LOC101860291 isoform X2 [Aplysia californica]